MSALAPPHGPRPPATNVAERPSPQLALRPGPQGQHGHARTAGDGLAALSPPTRGQAKTGEQLYLTPAQVAELLGVSEKTISRWSLEDASMPAFRRGRVVRFHRARLMAWLDRQEPRNARRMAQQGRKGSAPAP